LYSKPTPPSNGSRGSTEAIIPPEIKNDAFYRALQRLVRKRGVRTILEIGSSSGEGSTEAFVTAIRGLAADSKPSLFCLEVSPERHEKLAENYRSDPFVHTYRFSSVGLDSFPSESQIEAFHRSGVSGLSRYPLASVLDWLRNDIESVRQVADCSDGIAHIKRKNGIDHFDVVLIDGSEFTGERELEAVYGARWIALDDVMTYKNWASYARLRDDPAYALVAEDKFLRNGWAIFRRSDDTSNCTDELPIHFFTLVLNGEPFIRHHIETFRALPFRWVWHVIEGVADLKHDTAWSLAGGGRIPDSFHEAGLSNDGTSLYLDTLAAEFPGQVRVYRKPAGEFWDGKREMVNAPLPHILEECLLWQVDADELWTTAQIIAARALFLEEPERTAAFYWCWYFVGDDILITTRNCYAQNPAQEWLRTWRFQPGDNWARHEPPELVRLQEDGALADVAQLRPFTHAETEERGLVFQHFAYATPAQVRFKEVYYGYTGALAAWRKLQDAPLPAQLRDFLPWVRDSTSVGRPAWLGVTPLAGRKWVLGGDTERHTPRIVIDGVFFQLYRTGIARVWRSLLMQWAGTDFARNIVLINRAGTAPRIPGIRTLEAPAHDYARLADDQMMLQDICDSENASLFVSTYYSRPVNTRTALMIHDMMPEVLGADLFEPMWIEKRHAIKHASSYISVSNNSARDLVRIHPDIAARPITVAHCGVPDDYDVATPEEIDAIRKKYGITKPYFMLSGGRQGHKNAILFFKAFAMHPWRDDLAIVATGPVPALEPQFLPYVGNASVHVLWLPDSELRALYSGALALAYPSVYEGFGMPVVEAMACGCPVITTPVASIPEVGGNAALYVAPDDVDAMLAALIKVNDVSVRAEMSRLGLEQARKFSWSTMATTVMQALSIAASRPNIQTDLKGALEMEVKELILSAVGALRGMRLEEVHKACVQALRVAPHNPFVQYTVGIALLLGREPLRAMNAFTEALTQQPSYFHALNGLGVALRMLDQTADAITCFNKALELAPESEMIRKNLALVRSSDSSFSMTINAAIPEYGISDLSLDFPIA